MLLLNIIGTAVIIILISNTLAVAVLAIAQKISGKHLSDE